MTNIATLKPSERVIEILHPATEQPVGIRVTVLSLDDENLKVLRRQFQDEQNKLNARGKTMKAVEIDQNLNKLCVAAITGWEWYGDADFNDTKPQFTPKNVRDVVEQIGWFRDQISEAISETKSFFGK